MSIPRRVDVTPGARVSVVDPFDRTVVRARALNREMAGYQIASVVGSELRLMLMREGETWARGWSTAEAKALRAACAL